MKKRVLTCLAIAAVLLLALSACHTHTPVTDKAVPASCTKTGLTKGSHCNDCGAVLVAQEVVPMSKHNFASATCTEPEKCYMCGTTQGEALGHTTAKIMAKDPTCDEDGCTAGEKCEACGKIFEKSETLKKLGHIEVPVAAKDGLTEGISCSRCNGWVVKPCSPAVYGSKYGYEYLGTMQDGKALQQLYMMLEKESIKFQTDYRNLKVESGSQTTLVFELNVKNLGLNTDQVEAVRITFYTENPQYYWSYAYYASESKLSIYAHTDYAKGEYRREINEKLYRTVQAMKTDGESSYERALDFHNTIVNTMEYSYASDGSPNSERWAHNVVGYLLYDEGVCECYADTFAVVMNFNGMSCVPVMGYSNGAHKWNFAQMDDGKWYWFDLTFDDPTGGTSTTKYFCVPGNAVSSAHNIDLPIFGDRFTPGIPEMASTHYSLSSASAEKTLTEAYDLIVGHQLSGARTLTGKITKIDEPYSEQYDNITVIFEVDGFKDMPMMAYRLKGEYIKRLAVGDVVTVTGIIQNYLGTVEYMSGCTLDKYVPASCEGGHRESVVEAVPASCTEGGFTEGKKCDTCGIILEKPAEIKALGHTDIAADGITCGGCGKPVIENVEPERYATRYGYEYLGSMVNGAALQALYNQIDAKVREIHLSSDNCESITVASGVSDDYAISACRVFCLDNPQYYWIEAYSVSGGNLTLKVGDEFKNGAARTQTTMQLYKFVQDMVSDKRSAYDRARIYHDTVLDALASGEADSRTYANIFAMVMNFDGIPCITVSGESLGKPAFWNMAQMDSGEWYWFDLAANDKKDGHFIHRFFCVTDYEDIPVSTSKDTKFMHASNHTLDSQMLGESFLYELPDRATYPVELTTEQIFNAIGHLTYGTKMNGTHTLTGKIIAVVDAYNSTYKNVTVDIAVTGFEGTPVRCYRLAGDGADRLKVGDVITVEGEIMMYNNILEMAQGCKIK